MKKKIGKLTLETVAIAIFMVITFFLGILAIITIINHDNIEVVKKEIVEIEKPVANVLYIDVEEDCWAHDSIYILSDLGIVNGYGDTTFRPNNNVTYAEFLRMVLLATTNEDVGKSDNEHWATKYYEKALELAYINENDISLADMNKSINRGSMAIILCNILRSIKDNEYTNATTETNQYIYDEINMICEFTDINPETKLGKAILKASENGILVGFTDGTFKPDNNLTRAEATEVVCRLMWSISESN